MVKMGYDKDYYVPVGNHKTVNIRHRFYRLLHEALKNSYNISKGRKRTLVINDILFVSLNDVLFELNNRYSSHIRLNATAFITMQDINEIRII